jgi:hypothetical protein
MKHIFFTRRLPRAALSALSIVVIGCASTGGESGGCNSFWAGAIGAAAGAATGAAVGSSNRGAGAAIGGAVGGAVGALGCLAYNYSTRQKRSAKQVEKAYQEKQGALPQQTEVVNYSAVLQPGSAVASGAKATVVSNIELVKGRDAPQPKVEEQVEMRSPDGKVLNRARKPAQAIEGSGEYENQFKFTLPEGVDEGVYPIKLTLYVDGQEKQTRSVQMQVASSGATLLVAQR